MCDIIVVSLLEKIIIVGLFAFMLSYLFLYNLKGRSEKYRKIWDIVLAILFFSAIVTALLTGEKVCMGIHCSSYDPTNCGCAVKCYSALHLTSFYAIWAFIPLKAFTYFKNIFVKIIFGIALYIACSMMICSTFPSMIYYMLLPVFLIVGFGYQMLHLVSWLIS